MERLANEGGMISEQLWDANDLQTGSRKPPARAGLTFGLQIPRPRMGRTVQCLHLLVFGRMIIAGRATIGE
jgi:hypothetical protein